MQLGQPRGYGGSFTNAPVLKNYSASQREELLSQFSMKLWGNLGDEFLETIKSSQKLRDHFSFSNTRIKYKIGGQESAETVTDDWYYYGKVVSVGSSFNAHLNLVNKVFLENYKKIITEKIEGDLAINFVSPDGKFVQINGEPILIKFQGQIDLQIFIKSVFDGSKPFRLLGFPLVEKNDFVRISAVDLHIGEPLTFDLRPNSIEIYLPEGTCGNTVARFLALFQRHFVATSNALGKNYEELF